ncbi:MAG: tetratricopeptide repeat protein [Myxococcaceae bacterium]|nr:tetratricopeptide repeat protein [Myxococcaceae bacterium]
MSRRAVVVAGAVLALAVGGYASRSFFERQAAEAEAKRRDELAYAAQWDLDHGAPQQALEKLKALEQVDPSRKGLTSSLGRALVSTGAPTEALPVLERALQRDGPTPETLEYQAVALAQLGRHVEARATIEKALMMDDRRTSALRRLAQTHLTLGDVEPAIATWELAAQVAPPAERPGIVDEARALLTAAGHPDAGLRLPPERTPAPTNQPDGG